MSVRRSQMMIMVVTMNKETAELYRIMSDCSGESIEDLQGKGRRRPLPICRYLIGVELMRRDYSVNCAARQVGIDHATLWYGCKEIEKMHQNGSGYSEELMIEALFNRALSGETV